VQKRERETFEWHGCITHAIAPTGSQAFMIAFIQQPTFLFRTFRKTPRPARHIPSTTNRTGCCTGLRTLVSTSKFVEKSERRLKSVRRLSALDMPRFLNSRTL
jgi:hypothetical protein